MREKAAAQNRFWNASDACCNFFESEVDDSGYIRSIIDDMKQVFNVDRNRIYLIGHSNGGLCHSAWPMNIQTKYRLSPVSPVPTTLKSAMPHPIQCTFCRFTERMMRTIDFQGGDIMNGNRGTIPAHCDQSGAGLTTTDAARRSRRELRDLEASLPGHETGVLKFEVGCKAGGSAELWTISSGCTPCFL